jgi:L-alanine-DL-glutamate epimerase-like enolase superfamily enzyme
MDIAAGEYGYDLFYFERMLAARAVDVLQADATRCGGVTGFMRVAALAEAHAVPLSAHTAPSIHVHPCSAVPLVQHIEYFHDHVRIEHAFFEGAATAAGGMLHADRGRPGLGLELRRADAERYRKS